MLFGDFSGVRGYLDFEVCGFREFLQVQPSARSPKVQNQPNFRVANLPKARTWLYVSGFDLLGGQIQRNML